MFSFAKIKSRAAQLGLMVILLAAVASLPDASWAKSGSAKSVLTLSEAARYLRISKGEMKHLLKTRQIPYRVINRKVRISRKALQRYLNHFRPVRRQGLNFVKPLSDEKAKHIIGGRTGRPRPNELEESSSKRRRFRTAQTDEEKLLREKLLKQEEKEEILVEYLTLRGLGVLLEKNQLEVEGSVSYTHDTARGGTNFTAGEETNFDSGRFDGSLRYGLTEDTQLSLSLPVIFSQREEVLSTQTTAYDTFGIGDLSLGVRHHTIKEAEHGADVIPFLLASFPTNSEPENAFIKDPQLAFGQYGVTGGFTVIKSEDPAVFFFSYSHTHYFSEEVSGFGELGAFTTLDYSIGFSLAMNDDFAPFFSLAGGFYMNDRVISAIPPRSSGRTDANVILITIGADYRWSKNYYLEGSVSFGVTEDTSDVMLNIAIPYTFPPFKF